MINCKRHRSVSTFNDEKHDFNSIVFVLFCLFVQFIPSKVQDNRELQNRIAQSAVSDLSEMRSMHDELAILEESG